MNLADLARRETAKRKTERTERREKWTAAAELADLCRDMQPRVTYARNDSGEEYGERFEDRCKREGMVECAIHWRGVR
ncbi:MAG TPA: hypothetical protein VFH52_07420 [Rhodanobacteraceae bacterium]|nr:hypothetical protein [Rhodanobacteraceae bacterium]